MTLCNCIGPAPGKLLCPCQIRMRRQQVRRGDCLVCGAIGGHGGLQCPELAVSTATPPADAALIGKLRHQLAQVTEECAALRARSVPVKNPAPIELHDIPQKVREAAKLVGLFFLMRNVKNWELGPCASRSTVEALRARAVPEDKKYHDVAQRLYSILDDIDTASDIAKSDDKLYRGIVERTQAKKRDYVVSCDGYVVTLTDDSMLAASKAGGEG